MRFDIVTLFPEMPLLIEKFGITARASKLGLWQLKCWNPRDFVFDAHKTVDDRPFGGGPGMVLLAEPLAADTKALIRGSWIPMSMRPYRSETTFSPAVSFRQWCLWMQ